MKVLNPGPEEIRDNLVTTAFDDDSNEYVGENSRKNNIDGHALGVLSNNKWNVEPFLKEILRLLKRDVRNLEVNFRKKLNASQTAGKELVSRIAERNYFAITGIGD